MKKILAYVTPEKHAGFFDLVIAYDSDVDAIVPYTEIETADMKDVIYGAVFTRNPKELKNTAIFIGGHDFGKCQNLLDTSLKVFENLPPDFRVSVAFDPDGACTTAAACIAKIKSLFEISGKRAVILAGTGPVGQCAAVFLSKEGCKVSLTSRKMERAKEVAKQLKEKYKADIAPIQAGNAKETEKAISDAEIVIATGPEGVMLLPKNSWQKNPGVKVLADVNAVSLLGIEGVELKDDGIKREGKICFGAFAIGNLKMKIHYKLMRMLFEEKATYDLEKIYGMAKRERDEEILIFGRK